MDGVLFMVYALIEPDQYLGGQGSWEGLGECMGARTMASR